MRGDKVDGSSARSAVSVRERKECHTFPGRNPQINAALLLAASIPTRLGWTRALSGNVGARTIASLIGAGSARRVVSDLIELLRSGGVGVLDRGVTAASGKQNQARYAQDDPSDCRHDRAPFDYASRHNARNGTRYAKYLKFFDHPSVATAIEGEI